MSSSYTEDHLVEQPAIQLMQHELGWDVMNCFGEPSSQELRRSGWESALQRLNPDLPAGAIEGAVEELSRDFFFTAHSPVEADRKIANLLKGEVTLKCSSNVHVNTLVHGGREPANTVDIKLAWRS